MNDEHARIERVLTSLHLPAGDASELPTSPLRFPDGARYRFEIPSTEGPEALQVALDEGHRLDVPIHRVSQGSGVLMTTDAELDEWIELAAQRSVEVSLFARPNAGWDTSASAMAEAGGSVAPTARGQNQLVATMTDICRAADRGIRSVLIADVGVLRVFGAMRAAGELPADMEAKVSVMLPAANAASAALFVELGASTLNLPTDLQVAHIAAIRQAVDVPLDVYIESPANLGGFIRLAEIAEIVRVAAPVYLKFGLRNAPDIYPFGRHLRAVGLDMTRERVRRARLGLEALARSDVEPSIAPAESIGLALPRPRGLDDDRMSLVTGSNSTPTARRGVADHV